MAYGRTLHPNAPFTPEGRRRMVACVLDDGWSVTATAERFQVDPKTVRKWRDRYLAEGVDGLCDRSSRPHTSPNRTRRQLRRRVCRIRKKRRRGADHIAYEVGLATSTVRNILTQAGLGRLDRGDRATDTEPVRRYQRDTPGELIHVDIKKLAGIPDGGAGRPGRIGLKPAARSNGSTAFSSRNGPTSGPGDQTSNAPAPMKDSSTSTITTDPTDRSDGPPPSASSRTTSPKSTSSGRCIMVGAVTAILEVFGVCEQGEGSEIDPVGAA